MKKIKPNQKTALLAVLAAAVIMGIAFFIPPVLGSADNGEYGGVLAGNGLYKLDHEEPDEYFDYAAVKYGVRQYHLEQRAEFSSQNLLIQVAKGFHALFSKDKKVFDIRYYGVLMSLCMLAGLYLLVEYVAGKFPHGRVLIAAAAVFIFCDSAYLTWLMSFYKESMIYPLLLLLFACVLQFTESYHRPGVLFGIFAVSAALLAMADSRSMQWGLLTGGICLIVLYQQKKKNCFPLLLGRRGAYRKAALWGMAGIFLFSGIAFGVRGAENPRTEQYHAMTKGMMMSASNPEETAEFFEMDASYSLLDKSSAYEKYPVIAIQNELLEKDFYSKYDTGKIILYYISHGSSFGKMMQLMVNQAYTIHENTGGNYDRSAGREAGARTEFFNLYSRLKEGSVPRALGFLLILLVLLWICNRKNFWSNFFLTDLCVFGVCLMAAAVIKTGAADASRRLFFYNVAFDLLVLFLTAQLFDWLVGRRKKEGAKK